MQTLSILYMFWLPCCPSSLLRKKRKLLRKKKIAFNCKGTVKKFLPATISYLSFHQIEKRNLYSLDLGLLLWSTVVKIVLYSVTNWEQIIIVVLLLNQMGD